MCPLSTLAHVPSVWWKWTTARLDMVLTLPCPSPVTTHTFTHTHTHTHTHTGGQRPVNPQVREEEQRLARIFMTIAVLVVILIVFA